jgi:16S rRNA (guanine527-N7)-methyltransferase
MIAVAPQSVAGLDVSRETLDRLEAFASLIRRWTETVNLVSRPSLEHLWDRHILDSAQLFAFLPEPATHWADLGAGGGLPGMVVAVLAAELHPGLRMTLVESDQRKAAFLRQASQALGVSVSVQTQRIEALPALEADVISARALAPLTDLLAFSERHLRTGGTLLFPKGIRYRDEIEEARRLWDFDAEIHPSLSHPEAAVLIIRTFKRARQP